MQLGNTMALGQRMGLHQQRRAAQQQEQRPVPTGSCGVQANCAWVDAARSSGRSDRRRTLRTASSNGVVLATTTAAEYLVPEKFSLKPPTAPKPAAAPSPKPSATLLPRTRRVIMAGNWKMNPTSAKDATELAALLASAARTTAQDKPGFDVEVAVIPPFPFLPLVASQLSGTFAKLGAQDVHPSAKGAFTGAVSPGMLSSLGTHYVLAGHSERRTLFKEDDATINAKMHAILSAGMSPILCIGESRAEYEAGIARQVCSSQLRGGLAGVPRADMARVVIAYEPVWAIGTGLTATPAIAQGIHHYLRAVVADMYGSETAEAVRIQYGGSVTPETVDELMACPDIDGCLVGGASLAADKFSRIFSFQPPVGPRRLFAHDAVQCDCSLGESVVWSQRLQRLFWVDSMGKSLWSWDLKSDPLKWQAPEVVGCVALRADGGLLLGLESGLYGMAPSGQGEAQAGSWPVAVKKMADFEPGMATRPNDGRVDRAGNFVVGSYNLAHRQDGKEIGGLWRYTPDGHMQEILDHKVRCSNCVCFSPDGHTMYFTDTPTRRIFAFDYSPSGNLSNRRLLYEMPSAMPGGPDGAQTDSQGYLWVCLSGAGQVVRIAPDGSVDTIVELPVSSPTCCTIGGPNMDTLYVTTRKPDGGALYAVQLPPGVVGNPEPEFGEGSNMAVVGTLPAGAPGKGAGAFCTQCGSAHANASARFCHSCGAPRV